MPHAVVDVPKIPPRLIALVAMWALLYLAAPAVAAGAPPHVQLGTPDDLAVDQPHVQWELHDASGNLVGPQFDLGGGILDTGANGVLVARDGYFGDDFDYHPDIYQVARRADGSSVQYSESGVAGSDLFDVFVPYTLAYTADGVNQFEVPNFRSLGSFTLDLDGISAVAGMPLMKGHVVTMDTSAIRTDLQIATSISNTPTAPTSHSYHIPLQMLPAEHSPPLQPGDPAPTFADLPLVPNVTTASGGKTSTNTILLDTGSQFSMISSATAAKLGLNLDPSSPDTDVLGTLDVGGIGGTTSVPLVMVDRLTVPTSEGKDLILTDVLMGVIDIPTIGGIFGMNILTSGQFPDIFGDGGTGQPGIFDSVELDFRDGVSPTMMLNVDPLYDVTRQTLNWAGTVALNNWTTPAPGSPFVDGNGIRTSFTDRDYVLFNDSANFTTVNISAPVSPDWVFVDNTTKNYTFTGAGKITGNARLTKTGTGSLRIETQNDYTGPTIIAGGSVTFAARQDIGDVDVRAGASATFDTSQHFQTLDVGGNATLSVHGPGTLKTIATLGLKVGGRLDLTDNAIAVRTGSDPVTGQPLDPKDVLATLTGLIVSGRDGGPTKWTGIGLVSSSAVSNPNTTLGILINDDGHGTPRFTSLGGETLESDDVIVRWTLAGDANLDGTVGPGDFNLLAAHFGETEQTWATGDFNLDGTVGPSDFNLLASNFGSALPGYTLSLTAADWAALHAFNATAAPEPAGVVVFACIAPMVLKRRRRGRSEYSAPVRG